MMMRMGGIGGPSRARIASGEVRTRQFTPDVDLRRQSRIGFVGCRGQQKADRTSSFYPPVLRQLFAIASSWTLAKQLEHELNRVGSRRGESSRDHRIR